MAFKTHPYANCILYTDQSCGSDNGLEPQPINKAIAYLKFGLTGRYRNEVQAISVRRGCSLRIWRGNIILVGSEVFLK